MIQYALLLVPPAIDPRLVGDWMSEGGVNMLTIDKAGVFVWSALVQTKTIYPLKGGVTVRKVGTDIVVICQATSIIAPAHIPRPKKYPQLKYVFRPTIPALLVDGQIALIPRSVFERQARERQKRHPF